MRKIVMIGAGYIGRPEIFAALQEEHDVVILSSPTEEEVFEFKARPPLPLVSFERIQADGRTTRRERRKNNRKKF